MTTVKKCQSYCTGLSSLLLSLKAWICKDPCIWGVTARLFLLPSYRVHVRSGWLALIGGLGVHLYALPWRAEQRTRCWSKVETLRNERREGMEAYLFAVQWASKQATCFLIGLRTKRPSWSTLAAMTENQLPLLLADQIQSSSGIHFTLPLLLGHGTACRSTFTERTGTYLLVLGFVSLLSFIQFSHLCTWSLSSITHFQPNSLFIAFSIVFSYHFHLYVKPCVFCHASFGPCMPNHWQESDTSRTVTSHFSFTQKIA
jgi:hypothetical protein